MERKVKYNEEFKLRYINEVLKKNRSICSFARENNFDKSNLRKWISFYLHYSKEGLLPRKNSALRRVLVESLANVSDFAPAI